VKERIMDKKFVIKWKGTLKDGQKVEGISPSTFTEERAMYLAASMERLTGIAHDVVETRVQ
jgi:hypothetical protein